MKRKTIKEYEMRLRQLDRAEKALALKKQVEDRETALGLRRPRKRPAWAKVMTAVMSLLCLEIIIFTEAAMWTTGDLSALYALVGAAASLAASIWAYCEKSKAENTKGGIVYEKAMLENCENSEEPAGEDAAG